MVSRTVNVDESLSSVITAKALCVLKQVEAVEAATEFMKKSAAFVPTESNTTKPTSCDENRSSTSSVCSETIMSSSSLSNIASNATVAPDESCVTTGVPSSISYNSSLDRVMTRNDDPADQLQNGWNDAMLAMKSLTINAQLKVYKLQAQIVFLQHALKAAEDKNDQLVTINQALECQVNCNCKTKKSLLSTSSTSPSPFSLWGRVEQAKAVIRQNENNSSSTVASLSTSEQKQGFNSPIISEKPSDDFNDNNLKPNSLKSTLHALSLDLNAHDSTKMDLCRHKLTLQERQKLQRLEQLHFLRQQGLIQDDADVKGGPQRI